MNIAPPRLLEASEPSDDESQQEEERTKGREQEEDEVEGLGPYLARWGRSWRNVGLLDVIVGGLCLTMALASQDSQLAILALVIFVPGVAFCLIHLFKTKKGG
jgi:hypothetical protein